jgi:hypothetical protein
LCTQPVLPLEIAPAAEQLVVRLTALQEPGRAIGLGGTLDTAQRFLVAARDFDAIAEHWRARYAADPALSDEPAARLNEAMKRVNRLIIPLALTYKGVYGHDPYGFTPQQSMIPVLHDVPLLADLSPGEERWMLETELVRNRNRVSDALSDAAVVMREGVSGL